MPARSKSQQRLFGMVHAYQKGKLKNAPEEVKDIAESISEEDAEHFAKTKHKGLPEKKACIVYSLRRLEKLAGASKARQLVNWYIRRRREIAKTLSEARTANPYVAQVGNSWYKAHPLEGLDRELRIALDQEARGKLGNVFSTETISRFTTPRLTPRMAIFRGAPRLSVTGRGYSRGSGYSLINAPRVPGVQYAHATGDIDVASKGTYGKLLEVYNAKRVPGAVSGKLNWFSDTGAQSVANKDFTAVKGLYSKTGDPSIKKKLLRRESPGYETLIQTSKLQPDRLYLVTGGSPLERTYMDITSLKDMYFRAKTKAEQRAIGELIHAIS